MEGFDGSNSRLNSGSGILQSYSKRQKCCICCGVFSLMVISGASAVIVDRLLIKHGVLSGFGPYEQLTGNDGHVLPEMYNKVREKTIWLYWNKGQLPDHVQLCFESIQHNKGSFDVRLLHEDDVDKYVSRTELPFQWSNLIPAQQKDSLMNALLARYGGVALDLTVVLFEPLDEWWSEMQKQGSVFRGYQYSWYETAVWFLMSRAGGIFGHAVTAQVIGMGDHSAAYDYGKGLDIYFALGSGTLSPIIGRYDYHRATCMGLEKEKGICWPPMPSNASTGPELGPEFLMIREPGDLGPQLPYSTDYDFPLWDVSDKSTEWKTFEEIRKKGFMPFVKFFNGGGPQLKELKRADIIKRKNSFFCHLLAEAKSNQCDIQSAQHGDAQIKIANQTSRMYIV